MRGWASAAVLIGTVAVVSGSPLEASAACRATPVRGDTVRAGPFTGYITRPYDVLDGRFRLRVGKYRDESSGLTQKIPWFAPARSSIGRTLTLTAVRLGPRPRRYKLTRRRADSSDSPNKYVFPSIVAPPAEGCWRVTLTSGRTTARLTVLVRN
jgi:hypothetical protein